MNPEQWLSLKWNGGSTMSDRWLNQSKIIHKKLSSTDERYFKLAEYMLFSELSFVLNVPREHIEQYIADMIEA